ncbi:MAG: FlgD immunoglobulin-like domain containing protein, partial [Spirochaetia bacterium]
IATLNGAVTTLTVTAGTLNLNGNITATTTLANGGTVSVGANVLSVAGYSGGGVIQVNGGTLTSTAGAGITVATLTVTTGATINGGGTELTITNSVTGNLTLTGNVRLNGVTIGTLSNSGTLTLNGNVTSGALTNTGTIAVGGNTLSFTTYSGAGTVTTTSGVITASGAGGTIATLTVTTGATINGGGTGLVITNAVGGDLKLTGAVTLNGTSIGTLSNTGTLTLNGNITASGAVSNTGTIAVGGNTLTVGNLNGTVNGGSGSIMDSGAFTVTTFNCGTGLVTLSGAITLTAYTFYNLTITNTVTLLGGGTVNTSSLTCSGTLNATGGENVNATGNVSFAGGIYSKGTGTFSFSGSVAQTLTSGGQNLGIVQVSTATPGLKLLDSLTTDTLTIMAAGSMDINGKVLTASFVNQGTLYREGTAGEAAPIYNAAGTVVYQGGGGNIQTYGGAPGTPDYFNLQIAATGTIAVTANLAVAQDLTITSGTLQANAFTITISRNFNHAGGTFAFGTSTIVFVSAVVSQVLGNNTFYNLTVTTAGKEIDFGAGALQTFASGGTFTAKTAHPLGTEARILLHSTIPWPGIAAPAIPPADSRQWQLLMSTGSSVDLDWIDVDMSFAQVPVVPDDTTISHPDWVYNWRLIIPVLKSWTLDTNHNGKIDEIGVQVANSIPLNDNFGDIQVTVTGYTVTGYSTGSVANDDTFYILLKENNVLDTAVTPTWTITSNTTLKGQFATSRLVSSSSSETPIDTASPVVAYTLGMVGSNQLFVHFSEEVYHAGGTALQTGDFSFYKGASLDPTLASTAISDLGSGQTLLTLGRSLTADDVLLPVMMSVSATVQDGSTTPNVITIPVAPGGHRISDIGLGLPGSGLFEPVFAKDQTIRPATPGIGYINVFDGTKWLQTKQMLTVEGNISALSAVSYPPSGSTSLLYDIDVSKTLETASGLWLPGFTDDTTQTGGFSGLVPTDKSGDADARTVAELSPAPSNIRLRDFHLFSSADAKSKDGAVVNFFFSIPQGSSSLITASVPNPGSDSSWYLHVVPWAFTLHDIQAQRAGVSILNNVIDPDKGDTTTLQYILGTAGQVTVIVFDLSGSIVNVLVRGSMAAGEYETTWDGTNRGGRKVARGIYFIRIVAPGIDETRKVLVFR